MLKNTFFSTVFMTVTLLMSSMLATPPALAVTFTVNSTLDQPDDLTKPGTCHTAANTCTLRAAVMQANRTSGAGATIMVPSGIYTLTIPAAGVDGEENGDLNLTTPASGSPVITIIGAGANTTIIDANKLDRVFSISPGRTASISGLTIRNGFTLTQGGGIFNSGTLNLSEDTISGNVAQGVGGGILNDFSLIISNCTITGNHASGGGGISNNSSVNVSNSTISQNTAITDGGAVSSFGGTVKVSNSTIFGNGSNNGGGIYASNATLYVINSTISQNYANTNGGGISKVGILGLAALYNTTVIGNDADHDRDQLGGIGGGVYSQTGARFIVVNTLIASNTILDSPIYNDCNGTLEAYGQNLFRDMSGCIIPNAQNAGLILPNTIGPLQNNGGPTWTHALLPGSDAIDSTIDSLGCVDETGAFLTTDQRGAARVVGARCDIGAFEYGAHIDQSIQFGPVSNKTLTNSPFVITATSSSDLTVGFSTNTPSICTVTSGPLIAGVSSATVVLSGVGTCTLVAQQPGNQIFNPALAVTQTFNVTGSKTFLPLVLR